jgi:hypothetical protein
MRRLRRWYGVSSNAVIRGFAPISRVPEGTRGKVAPTQPVLTALANIKEQDALVDYGGQDILSGQLGRGRTENGSRYLSMR